MRRRDAKGGLRRGRETRLTITIKVTPINMDRANPDIAPSQIYITKRNPKRK